MLRALQQLSGQTVGSKKKTHFVGLRQSAVDGRYHSSRIGFSVAADINSNVVDIYFLVWSLSRLSRCVGSGSNVAATSDRTATGIGMAEIGIGYLNVLSPKARCCCI